MQKTHLPFMAASSLVKEISSEMRSYNLFAEMGDGSVKNDIGIRISAQLELLEAMDLDYQVSKWGDRYRRISVEGISYAIRGDGRKENRDE